jgi:hypothetical protein
MTQMRTRLSSYDIASIALALFVGGVCAAALGWWTQAFWCAGGVGWLVWLVSAQRQGGHRKLARSLRLKFWQFVYLRALAVERFAACRVLDAMDAHLGPGRWAMHMPKGEPEVEFLEPVPTVYPAKQRK